MLKKSYNRKFLKDRIRSGEWGGVQPMEFIAPVKEEWGNGESQGEGLQHGNLLIRPRYEAAKSESQNWKTPYAS